MRAFSWRTICTSYQVPVENNQNLRDRKLPGRLRRHRDAGLFVDPNPGEKLAAAFLRTKDWASPFFTSNHADRPREPTSDVMTFRARVSIVSPSHECWLRMIPPDKYSWLDRSVGITGAMH